MEIDDKAIDVAAKRMHEAYLLCRDVFDPHNTIINNEAHVKAATNREAKTAKPKPRSQNREAKTAKPAKRPLTTIFKPYIITNGRPSPSDKKN